MNSIFMWFLFGANTAPIVPGPQYIEPPVSVYEQSAWSQWDVYHGNWFDISYPSSFKPVASNFGRSVGSPSADGAMFISPDKEVTFYVYSPLWTFDAEISDIALSPASETVVADSRSYDVCDVTHYWIIDANDGSYSRSYVDVIQRTHDGDEPCDVGSYEQKIFGVRYTDQDAYDRYYDQYMKFKNSLIQYAD
jgi:hypothetical protein